MQSMKERVRGAAEILGKAQGSFQFRDVRSALRIGKKDRNAGRNAFEALRSLLNEGVLEVDPATRDQARHRYYRLVERGGDDTESGGGERAGETVVQLSDGDSLTFWGDAWEVADGHLTVLWNERREATFAPGAWTYCVGHHGIPMEWAQRLNDTIRAAEDTGTLVGTPVRLS